MFKSIKCRTLIYAFAVLLVAALVVICLAVKEAKRDIQSGNDYEGVVTNKIVVDPGHGGFDGGASGNGVTEKDINLAIGKKLKEELTKCEMRVIMTREEDCSTADENRPKNISAKKSDLLNRKNMAEENNADIFVSIHMNKFEDSKYFGAQVFYADTEESKRLGECIQKAMPRVLNDGNTRVAKKAEKSVFILNGVKVPSVIIECGFLSNKKEAESLKNDEYQKNVAKAITQGIKDYLESVNCR